MRTKTSSDRRWHRGFTLVELLVVIAIISMLAALLLPALETTRKKAEQITCLSNMKQFSTVFDSYMNDFSMHYPTNVYFDDNTRAWQRVFQTLEYVPVLYRSTSLGYMYEPTGILYCPESHRQFRDWVYAGGRPGYQFLVDGKPCTQELCYFSYSYPVNLHDAYNQNYPYVAIGGRREKATLGLPAVEHVRASYIKSSPSNTQLLMEFLTTKTTINPFTKNAKATGCTTWFSSIPSYAIHDSSSNILWADGHAGAMNAVVIQTALEKYAATGDDSAFHFQLGR